MKTWCRTLVLCLLTLSLVVPATPAAACGPVFTSTVFSYSYHPDFPLDDFAEGSLGVIAPRFMSYYLPVAYRYLSDKPLSAAEQKAALTYWHERIDPALGYSDDPVGDWVNNRRQVPGAPAVHYISASRSGDIYYFNCTDDAFSTASRTLKDRINTFGKTSEEVRQWLAAQDAVFENCSGGTTIPPEAPADMPPLIKADRAYQMAAACFYSGNFDEAEARFRNIARDTSSPWHTIAPYLAARAILRKSSVTADYGKNNMAELERAEKAFQEILKDKSLAEFHDSARGLLNLIAYRRDPATRLSALSARMSEPGAGGDLQKSLKNYIYIFNNLNPKRMGQLDDMTDWIYTVKYGTFEHSLEKWKETSSRPWLVAALMKAGEDSPDASSLLEQAAKVKTDMYGYLTVTYYRALLLDRMGDSKGFAKVMADIIARDGEEMPMSAYNRFMSLQAHHARDLEEFLTYARQRPVGVFIDYDGYEIPEGWKPGEPAPAGDRDYFDIGAGLTFDQQMPVTLLLKAAASDTLPDHLRARLAIAAWTRAVVVDEDDAAGELASMITKLEPGLRDDFSAYLAASGAERKFVAQFIILKHPGMRPSVSSGVGRETPLDEIDSYRDNWWCSGKYGRATYYPDFVTEAQYRKAQADFDRIVYLGHAPTYLARGVIEWAKSHPKDPRVPEALHRAVKATRYGCKSQATGELSKEAFTILHDRYPDSPWAKETPYWYN